MAVRDYLPFMLFGTTQRHQSPEHVHSPFSAAKNSDPASTFEDIKNQLHQCFLLKRNNQPANTGYKQFQNTMESLTKLSIFASGELLQQIIELYGRVLVTLIPSTLEGNSPIFSGPAEALKTSFIPKEHHFNQLSEKDITLFLDRLNPNIDHPTPNSRVSAEPPTP